MTAPRGPGRAGLLLHIGVPKSATTALQSCLAASRHELRDAAIIYPGTADSHVAAVRHPLRWPADPDEKRIDIERWNSLLTECHGFDGRAIVSAESLAAADDLAIGTVLDSLGREDVHVVVTIRSLAHILPSAWQEDVKAGVRTPFVDWLEHVCNRGADTIPNHPFWVVHDHATVVERWAQVVGNDRITVVVVDSRDRNAVYRAFEGLLGLERGALSAERASKQNRSLTANECEVLRRLNERLDHGDTPTLRRRPVPAAAIWALLDGRQPPSGEAKLEVPRRFLERIGPSSEETISRIRETGATVIGELDHLAVDRDTIDNAPDADQHPPDTMPMDAAVALLSGIVRSDARA